MMNYRAARKDLPWVSPVANQGRREVPAGGELFIAATLGIVGWWCILHVVSWLTG